jgi:hypothetical protein
MGVGLAAASGFRVFIPLLGLAVASRAGLLELSSGFGWLETTPALLALAVATLLEVGAYYIPWLDHLLDALTTPASVAAGVVLTASLLPDSSPLLRWGLAIIAGGGAAGLVQTGTVALRALSLVSTGGSGNWLVAKGELVMALLLTLLVLLLPLAGLALALATGFWIARRLAAARGTTPGR